MKINLTSGRQMALVTPIIYELLLVIIIIPIVTGTQYGTFMEAESNTNSVPHRKILLRHDSKVGEVLPNRAWGDKCSKFDILVNQGQTAPLPSGIPTYTVEITNVCITGCNISGIHLSCGWFSSARLINPRLFKRLSYDDCLVNDGKPLHSGQTIAFEYANTYSYPLSVSSVSAVICP